MFGVNQLKRLQKYISECGYTSRRKAEELIAKGVVTVNDIVVTEAGTKVSETDEVKRSFNFDALQALEKLNQMNYILNDEAYKDDKFNNDISLLLICRENDDFGNDYFSQSKFNKLIAFLEKGYTAKDVRVLQYKTYGQIVALEKLLERGIDLNTATYISNNCYDKDGNLIAVKSCGIEAAGESVGTGTFSGKFITDKFKAPGTAEIKLFVWSVDGNMVPYSFVKTIK